MCGIAGILRINFDRQSQKRLIEKMISTLSHRGPDGWGIYLAQDVVLGHTRLSILDLTAGNQPMMSDRYVIVYNGEVYNYIELRKELVRKGIQFYTNSDTEVVLKAFEVYGTNCFSKLNGQFALIIWDKKDKTLTIARDRYGIRPLYILQHKNIYYFSSEMKAFDKIEGYQREFNMENVFEHALLWNTIGDNTLFKNIRALSAGTFEIYEVGNSPTKHRYYEIGESLGTSPNLKNAIEEFSEILRDAVNLRLRSDVPVASYLSGGIDSSVITHLAALNKKEKLKTFSIAFEDKDFDESAFQREVVSQINSNHCELKVNYKLIDDTFLDAVYHFERPVFRTAPVPLYLLSKQVNANGIKVVLTGEAGDEILFGYDSYKEVKLMDFWSKQPASELRPLLIKKLYPHLRHYKNPMQFALIRMFYEGFLKKFRNELVGLNIRVQNNNVIAKFFNKDFKPVFENDNLLEKIRKTLPENFYSWSLLRQNQFLEMKTLLAGYLLSSQGDRMSMANSVEARYPFLDHRLVEKVFYYEDTFKLNGFREKHLLKEAFKGAIPKSVITRPKMPYMAPDLKCFVRNGKLSENAAYFLSKQIISDYGIFDAKYVNRLIKKFENGGPSEIGYRDNMLITFILSAQMVKYWIGQPKRHELEPRLKRVEICDY